MNKCKSIKRKESPEVVGSSKQPELPLAEAVETLNLSEDGDTTAILPPSALRRLLRCPVCSNVPIPPIFNCAKGHIICSKCRPQRQKCGLCSDNYGDSRNFVLEQIVESTTIVCDHRAKGCPLVLKGQNYANHVKAREFGPIECFQGESDNCNRTLVDLLNYKQHLIVVHNAEEYDHENGNFSCKFELSLHEGMTMDVTWTEGYVNLDGKTFVTRTFCRGGSMHFSVVLAGTDADAKKYNVRMTFSLPESDLICHDLTLPVRTIRASNEVMSRNYIHANLTKEMLASFCEVEVIPEDGKQKYTWKITYKIWKNVSTSS